MPLYAARGRRRLHPIDQRMQRVNGFKALFLRTADVFRGAQNTVLSMSLGLDRDKKKSRVAHDIFRKNECGRCTGTRRRRIWQASDGQPTPAD
jgi:hypothetical protein